MMNSACLALVTLLFAPAWASEIEIENFAKQIHSWKAKNDPIMGGKSTSSVTIQDGMGIFDGEVVDVPFLQAPGFITMETKRGLYPDVSSCSGLKLSLRASEEYHGYRFSFGNVHVPGGRFAFGYKANFSPPVGDDLGEVEIPFTDFSAKWDDATGDQIVTCEEDSKYCPTIKSLQNLKTMAIWGEGVAGKVHLEILTISAVGCDDSVQDNYIDEQQDEIDIESFDDMQHKWECMNDPVMGGKSTGAVSVENGVASFDGKVAIVPFLQAPGFITMRASGGVYPDVSSCNALKLVLMATEEYHGYRVSFGTVHLPNGHHATGYKANFEAPVNAFDEVVVPFSDFSSQWDDATGDQIVTCEENSIYCPDAETLSNMKTISVWGEGVAGIVKLKIKSISATGCASMEGPGTTPKLGMIHPKQGGAFSLTGMLVFGMVAVIAGVIIVGVSKRRRNKYNPVQEIENLGGIM